MKRLAAIAAVIISTFIFSSCTGLDESGNASTIRPKPDGTVSSGIVLYYYSPVFLSLVAVEETVEVPIDQRKELYILEKLIDGPDSNPFLNTIINSKTKVISVTDSASTISVTLSNEFLRLTESALKISDDKNMLLRMCVYSVVNSLTEYGQFDKVQILIDVNNTGIGERVTRGVLGFTDNPEEYLESLSRDDSTLLTPRRALKTAFELIENKDWSTLYSLIPETQERLEYELFSSLCNTHIENLVLEDELSYGSVAPNGKTAVITASFRITGISERSYQDIPIVLNKTNDIWMLSYSLFELYLFRS